MKYFKKMAALASFITGAYLLTAQVFLPILKSMPSKGNQMVLPGNIKPLKARESPVLGSAATATESFFYLSIPKLSIEDAQVKANIFDLDPKGFIGHLQGTVLPGEAGISFLYGHSVLPWFFDALDYDTIFSTLHHLNFGDSFTIERGNESDTFEVIYKITLKPEEVSPFMQSEYFSKNESWVILMTCTPPGLDTKRLLIIGKRRG
ncbi:MAG: sortase [bacterium]